MNNKGGKTFSDLFSDMSSDNDISSGDESKEKITFDNLFDKATVNVENDADISEKELKNNDIFVEQEKSSEKTVAFDDLFSSAKEQLDERSNGLFFDNSTSFSEKNQNVEEKVSSIFEDGNHFDEKLESSSTVPNNLFFDLSSKEEDSALKKENDIFDKNSNIEEKKLSVDESPFFVSNTDEKHSFSSSSESDHNDMFNDELLKNKNIIPEQSEDHFSNIDLGNIFFKQKNSSSDDLEQNSAVGDLDKKVSIEENGGKKDTFLEKNKPLKEEEVEEQNTIVSPFFEEVSSSDFSSDLEKINLVENEEHPKKIQKLDLDNLKHYSVKIEKKKEPLFKFVLGVISYAIFIWLLLIGIALLVYVLDIKIRASKGDYSSPTFNAYVVLTGSMLPEIQVNDVVVTKKVDASTLNVGDVITFASADSRFLNTIITHRIIKKEYDSKTKSYSFQTQGDNNNVADSALVPQNNIYGKVIIKIPKLGYLQEFLASDGGWIIVILIPCLTVISYDVVKLFKGLKRKKSKNITIQK